MGKISHKQWYGLLMDIAKQIKTINKKLCIYRIAKFFSYIKLARDGKAANEEKELRLYELIKQKEPDRILYHSKNIYPLL